MPPPSVRRSCEKSTWSKPGVEQPREQRVLTPVSAVKRIELDRRDEGRYVARVGDQVVVAADAREHEEVPRRQREDVVYSAARR